MKIPPQPASADGIPADRLVNLDVEAGVPSGTDPLDTVIAWLEVVHGQNSRALPGTWWPIVALKAHRASLPTRPAVAVEPAAGRPGA
jgi:hypothetical protein